ncbi:MAG: TonB-dependent receptor [Paludibacteraceae bacterium]|nr:TonB-dependent receptor [Paludibacteraceae bacterium]
MKQTVTTVLALLTAGVVNCQEVSEVDSLKSFDLQEIEIESLQVGYDHPATHVTVEAEELQRRDMGKDVPYLLQNTPSVIATSDAGNGVGYTDIRMRGYDGTRVNVTVNGVPLNDAESHKVYWVDTPDLLSASSDIQVLRGAGTSTAGTGSFGGAIVMRTETLPLEFGGEASMSYGSYNTNRQSLRIGSGLLGKHWVVDGRLSHISSDGYMERASSQLHSYLLQAGWLGDKTSVRLLSFGGGEHTYNAWDGVSAEQMAVNRRYNPCGEIEDDSGAVTGFYADQKDNFMQFNQQLVLNHAFSGKWNLNATLHYTYGAGYYQQYKNGRTLKEYGLTSLVDANGDALEYSNLVRRKGQKSHFAGALASANYKSGKWHVSMGASYNLYLGDHSGRVLEVAQAASFEPAGDYYGNFSRKHDFQVFGKMEFRATRGLLLTADAQYRWVNHSIRGIDDVYDYTQGAMQRIAINEVFNFFNPKLGVSYTFRKAGRLYASAGMSHREPTRKDFVNAIGDDKPRPERLVDVEAGYQFNNAYVSVGANLYYMFYKDQLVLTGAQNPDTYEALYVNVPDSYRRGIELEVKVTPLAWMWIAGQVTLSQNRIRNFTEILPNEDTWVPDTLYCGTTTLAYSPSVLASGTIGFTTHGFEGVWRTRFVSSQYATNADVEALLLPSYCVTDLMLSYSWTSKKGGQQFRVGLNVLNLLNSQYVSNAFSYSAVAGGSRYDALSYFPQAPIHAMGQFSIRF